MFETSFMTAERGSTIMAERCNEGPLPLPAPLAVVCIPTFRRPQMLASTLDSLVAQRGDVSFAVMVVDNDARARAGMAVAQAYLDDGRLRGAVTLEAKQGNCHAINAAFGLARARFPSAQFFLMIDDDEVASPDWLSRMVGAAIAENADIVGGPVRSVFPQDAPDAFRRHPLYHSTYSQNGPVPMIYGSGNCLIRRRVFEQLDRQDFNVEFNTLGGGDTEFFTRCRLAGCRSYWAQDALIHEAVPPARLRARWILLRSLRTGAINHKIERLHARGIAAWLRLALKTLAVLPASVPRGLRLYVQTGSPLAALHPPVAAIGRLLAVFGIHPEPYRNPVS